MHILKFALLGEVKVTEIESEKSIEYA